MRGEHIVVSIVTDNVVNALVRNNLTRRPDLTARDLVADSGLLVGLWAVNSIGSKKIGGACMMRVVPGGGAVGLLAQPRPAGLLLIPFYRPIQFSFYQLDVFKLSCRPFLF